MKRIPTRETFWRLTDKAIAELRPRPRDIPQQPSRLDAACRIARANGCVVVYDPRTGTLVARMWP